MSDDQLCVRIGRVEVLGAYGSGAVIKRLRNVDARRVRGRVTKKLLISLVAPLQTRRHRNRIGKRRNLPGVADVEIEVRFLLLKFADVEVGGRLRSQRHVDGTAQ